MASPSSDKLVDLLVFGSIFKKSTERDWALKLNNPNGDEGVFTRGQKILGTTSVLADFISSPIIAKSDLKLDILHTCKLHAKQYLDKSAEHIQPSNDPAEQPVSYSEANDLLDKITGSSYSLKTPYPVDYTFADIRGFWDIGKSRLPYEFNNYTAMSSIVANIEARLKIMGLHGELHIVAFGKQEQFRNIDFRRLNMTFVDSPTVGRTKKTSGDKKLIEALVSWTYNHLETFKEPANALVISEDNAVVYAVEEAVRNGFQVVLAHGGNTTLELRNLTHLEGRFSVLASPPPRK